MYVQSIAWNTFIWYATEPENIVFLRKGETGKTASIGELLKL